jgi:hypothetical protein
VHQDRTVLFEKEELVFDICEADRLSTDLAFLSVTVPGGDSGSPALRQAAEILAKPRLKQRRIHRPSSNWQVAEQCVASSGPRGVFTSLSGSGPHPAAVESVLEATVRMEV